MRSDVHVVANMYAPIAYPPSTALVFRPPKGSSGGHPELVATESLLSVNPNRMVINECFSRVTHTASTSASPFSDTSSFILVCHIYLVTIILVLYILLFAIRTAYLFDFRER